MAIIPFLCVGINGLKNKGGGGVTQSDPTKSDQQFREGKNISAILITFCHPLHTNF